MALVAFSGVIGAQNPSLTRTIVTKADVSVPNREAVVARIEVAPGSVAGWHTHPGDEIGYVTEGEATLMIAGQTPRKVSAGEVVQLFFCKLAEGGCIEIKGTGLINAVSC